MRIIEKLNNFIDEEIKDSEKYAKCALNYKKIDPTLAQVFSALSFDELKHMNMLHDAVIRKITAYRQTNGEPPENMQAIYDYLHERQIQAVNDIKAMQSEFKST